MPTYRPLSEPLTGKERPGGPPPTTRALIAGWFSFDQMGATAGDLMARDVVRRWLTESGIEHDVALAPPFAPGVDWRSVEPDRYTHVVFVCGPFGNGEPVTELLARFEGKRLIGVDLSMLEPLESWNPFDLLIERDSSVTSRPDLSLLDQQPLVPVVGLVLIQAQAEYGSRSQHQRANAALEELVASTEAAVVRIDTRLDVNASGLRTPREVESLIARTDVVLTTRLHGLVLALKHGVPAIAVDPVSGGAKISQQAAVLQWPFAFSVDRLEPVALTRAFEIALGPEGRTLARQSRESALRQLASVRGCLLADFE